MLRVCFGEADRRGKSKFFILDDINSCFDNLEPEDSGSRKVLQNFREELVYIERTADYLLRGKDNIYVFEFLIDESVPDDFAI